MNASTTTDETTALQKTRRGRWRMFFVLLVCAAPVVASYVTYYVIRPVGRTNYGELIQPQRPMPDDKLPLKTLENKDVRLSQLRGNWLLVSVDSGRCEKRCADKLYWMRQLRTVLGKEREHLDRLWLVSDDAALAKELHASYEGTYTIRMMPQITNIIKRDWLITPASTSVEEHLFLIDPQGNAMMRFPPDADANKIKRDLIKLVRASVGWHVPKPPQVEGAAL